MKYALIVVAIVLLSLAVPRASIASRAQDQLSQTDSPAGSKGQKPTGRTQTNQTAARPHHHLINLKLVLVREPPDPTLDFGDGKAAIQPQRISSSEGVSLMSGQTSPNVFLCRDRQCGGP